MALHESRLQTPEDRATLTGITKVIKNFNRSTTWVATGLLGSVVFAAVMVAFREQPAQTDNSTREARQITANLLPNANAAEVSDAASSNENSPGQETSGPAASVDFNLTPEPPHPDPQANATARYSAPRADSGRATMKIPNVRLRSSVHPRYVDAKMRLIALWHQSLRHGKARGPMWFSKSNKWQEKTVSYTAANPLTGR